MLNRRHFLGAGAECQAEHLMTKANAKHRNVGIYDTPYGGNGIGSRGRRIAGAVGEKNAVRLMPKNICGC